eukprot:370910_1
MASKLTQTQQRKIAAEIISDDKDYKSNKTPSADQYTNIRKISNSVVTQYAHYLTMVFNKNIKKHKNKKFIIGNKSSYKSEMKTFYDENCSKYSKSINGTRTYEIGIKISCLSRLQYTQIHHKPQSQTKTKSKSKSKPKSTATPKRNTNVNTNSDSNVKIDSSPTNIDSAVKIDSAPINNENKDNENKEDPKRSATEPESNDNLIVRSQFGINHNANSTTNMKQGGRNRRINNKTVPRAKGRHRGIPRRHTKSRHRARTRINNKTVSPSTSRRDLSRSRSRGRSVVALNSGTPNVQRRSRSEYNKAVKEGYKKGQRDKYFEMVQRGWHKKNY